ncbi:YcnI family protein [Phytoactinopolyspora halotolerans]|uniref:YcnI family protein n=2 Tax=Phytoactinopolyspora halotolerans TaxID=1981512 RepID=A0A6L9SFH2_9ACTN|nr:YcnI family protein [Phytoactinopolyspora halotolerans]
MSTRARRTALALAGASALVFGGAAIAGAHVTVSPEEASAGSYTVLTFSVPHGCDGSATTEVAIDIPDAVAGVTPTLNPNWDVELLKDDGSPAEGEPASRIVYTAHEPLPDDLRDAFELSVAMPDQAGETLAFPVIQTCEQGQTAWDEIPEDGQDPHELERPAPTVVVVEAEDDGHGGASDGSGHGGDGSGGDGQTDEGTADDVAAGDGTAGDGSDTDALSVAGLGAGVVGIVLGGAALLYARQRIRAQH